MRSLISVTLFGLLAVAGAWDKVFKTSQCYPRTTTSNGIIYSLSETRMPISMDNFIALLEKYEFQHSMTNPDRIAESLIARYRKDGIVYDPDHTGGLMFQPREQEEVNKQDIITKLLTPSFEVPVDTFEPREECSLHFMTSHSTDIYPHPEVDGFWNGDGRYRRSVDQMYSSYALPPGVYPAQHPIESGVILTNYGPVALGTLLTGIASSVSSSEQTINSVLGDKEVNYMPSEMKSKRLNPLYVSTIAGDIGQSALKAALISTQSKNYIGPTGMFSNSSAVPKIYTLADGFAGTVAYLTRAEIYAGIDALLIQSYLTSASNSKTKLSQVLRMYYSDRGLPNNPDARACNRIQAYRNVKDEVKTKEQALNFMYAYGDTDSLAHQFVTERSDDFPFIENFFASARDDAYNAFIGSLDSIQNEDYDACPIYSSNKIKCETRTDLVVVYNREGTYDVTQAEREYITLMSEMIGVGRDRSRLGVIDARNGDWLLPVTNVSNIADLGANFTMNYQQYGGGGSSADMMTILDTLRRYYFDFYNVTNSSAQNATAPSQVVVWNVPTNAPDFNDDKNLKILRDFRLDFPNVYFLLVGNNFADYQNVLSDREHDFFKVNLLDTKQTAREIADRICQIPSIFVYPACNTDIPEFTNYREETHLFQGYVSPNYTTYAMIAPINFKFSYRVKLMLQSPDVQVCTSRESMTVDQSAKDYNCQNTANSEFQWYTLCTEQNLTRCNPIYLSISGTPSGNPRCDADACEFPNQIEYKIAHDGLLCGAWSFSISFLLLAIVALLHIILV